jgi:hypothetical protein
LTDFEGSNDRRVSGNTVKTNIRFTVFNKREEIGVRAVTSEILRPRRTPGKDESTLDRCVE